MNTFYNIKLFKINFYHCKTKLKINFYHWSKKHENNFFLLALKTPTTLYMCTFCVKMEFPAVYEGPIWAGISSYAINRYLFIL
jgi:hypothetical protein